MVSPTDSSLEKRLTFTLQQWRRWQCVQPLTEPPSIVGRLNQGISNDSFKASADGQAFAIRLHRYSGSSKRGEANRASLQREWQVLCQAHDQQLAPKPIFMNLDIGCLVCEFICTETDTSKRVDLAALAELLRGIHRLRKGHSRINLQRRCHEYEHTAKQRLGLSTTPVDSYKTSIMESLSSLEQQHPEVVRCHNDLLAANRLYRGNHYIAIDWEYSACGSPWFELAVIIVGDQLNHADTMSLLQHYLQRPPTKEEYNSISLYCCVYRYTEILWYWQAGLETPDMESSKARVIQLVECL